MLRDRIIYTLRFFDLQDYPLTLLELHEYLLADLPALRQRLDERWEIKDANAALGQPVGLWEVLSCVQSECAGEVEERDGFYCLFGRGRIVEQRLQNYFYGFRRERLIRRYAWFLRYIPFVRGAALAGSQALGQQKQGSDIDLLIIAEEKFLWLARMLITAYFQLLGRRRYGKNIADRFCLNHYLAGPRELTDDRNLYTAVEYAKLRPLAYSETIAGFQRRNMPWICAFLPNAVAVCAQPEYSRVQHAGEKMLTGLGAAWWDKLSGFMQLKRIKQGEFIVASNSELSFHPHNRKRQLFEKFFGPHKVRQAQQTIQPSHYDLVR